MRNDHYPTGTVDALLLTDKVTHNTRLALQARLDKKHITIPRFFNVENFITLHAVCMRLVPQPDPKRLVDLAGGLDHTLAEGKGNGWRYDAMPADEKVFTIGLSNINKTAGSIFHKDFHLLSATEQDALLISVQSGTAAGFIWNTISSKLFFEEFLAAIVELYYSHPFAKEDIGEVAMADAKGWKKIGLNQREEHEPETLKDEVNASL